MADEVKKRVVEIQEKTGGSEGSAWKSASSVSRETEGDGREGTEPASVPTVGLKCKERDDDRDSPRRLG